MFISRLMTHNIISVGQAQNRQSAIKTERDQHKCTSNGVNGTRNLIVYKQKHLDGCY